MAAAPLSPWLRSRVAGLVVLACCLVSGVALAVPGKDTSLMSDGTTQSSSETIYSWTGWVLLATLVIAALVLTWRPSDDTGRRAAAVGLAVAAQLAGTGAVAVKHWKPHIGLGAPGSNLVQLQLLAVAMTAAGAISVAVCLWPLLHSHRSYERLAPITRGFLVSIGLLLSIGLPWAIAGGTPEMLDITSLGAMALLFSLPWGLSIVLSGWLSPRDGLVLGLAVAASVLLALVGPDMLDLMYSSPTTGFVAALAAAVLAVAVQTGALVRGRSSAPASAGTP